MICYIKPISIKGILDHCKGEYLAKQNACLSQKASILTSVSFKHYDNPYSHILDFTSIYGCGLPGRWPPWRAGPCKPDPVHRYVSWTVTDRLCSLKVLTDVKPIKNITNPGRWQSNTFLEIRSKLTISLNAYSMVLFVQCSNMYFTFEIFPLFNHFSITITSNSQKIANVCFSWNYCIIVPMCYLFVEFWNFFVKYVCVFFSRNVVFHYGTGVSVGLLASFLILIFMLSRFIPKVRWIRIIINCNILVNYVRHRLLLYLKFVNLCIS